MDAPTSSLHRAASTTAPSNATPNNAETRVNIPISIFDEDGEEIVLERGNRASRKESERQQAVPKDRTYSKEKLAQKALARKQKLFPNVSPDFLLGMPDLGSGRQAHELAINSLTMKQKLQLGAELGIGSLTMPPPGTPIKRKHIASLNSGREHREFRGATESLAGKQLTTAAGEKPGRVTSTPAFSQSFRHDVLDEQHDRISVGGPWAGTQNRATDDQVDAIGYEIEQGIEKGASPAKLVPLVESFLASALSCGAKSAHIIPGITEKLVLHFRDDALGAAYQVVAAAIKTLAAIKSNLGAHADIAIDLFDPEDRPDEDFLLLLENYAGAGTMPGHDRDAFRYIDLQKRIDDYKNTD